MQVQPSYDFVQWNQEIDVLIYAIPTQPVKAWELKFSFDPNHIQIISIDTGDFFGNSATFYSSGIIDNVNGTLINVYQLILGPGTVSEPGVILIIHCQTMGIGVSSLHLYDWGVTNETKYVELTVQDGAIQVYGDYYPWDINQDGHCNYLDLSSVAGHYMDDIDPPGSLPWDVVIDGQVNYLDVSALVSNYQP
jgi:hypothetical protein